MSQELLIVAAFPCGWWVGDGRVIGDYHFSPFWPFDYHI